MPLELPTRHPAESPSEHSGVLPSQGLLKAIEDGMISAGEHFRIPPASIQPASVDLRLGETAWPLQCSFLPDPDATVEEKVAAVALDEISIRDGAMLERGRPYLIPLMEELDLPREIRGKTNPKSSTGRLDVFTRVITDRNTRFDEIPAGYRGRLYLEVVPLSFAVRVERMLSLNQLRLSVGEAQLRDAEIREVHGEIPLLYTESGPVASEDLSVDDGLFVSVDLSGEHTEVAGFRSKRNSRVLDMGQIGQYDWRDFWEPVYPERGGHIILEPESFYLLLSFEEVCVPPQYAAEMMAYDPTAGELRTHYAGFFDPGFGYDPSGAKHGSRAALEVRVRDVPFMVEHRQAIGKLGFERMLEPPERLYGDSGSHYQGQTSVLSKHFARDKGVAER